MKTNYSMAQALRTIPLGLTSEKWTEFLDLLPQSNDMQLEVMIKQIRQEQYRRDR